MHDWADAERIRGVLNDDDRLVSSFRMYVAGGLEPVPSWLIGDLVPILGAGVCAVVLDMVRETEDSALAAALEPYYVAFEAEVALHRGDEREALRLAEDALATLPEFEALLRARVAAIAGRPPGSSARPQTPSSSGPPRCSATRASSVAARLALPATLKNEATRSGRRPTRRAARRLAPLRLGRGRVHGHHQRHRSRARGLFARAGRRQPRLRHDPARAGRGGPDPAEETTPGPTLPGTDPATLDDDDYAAMTAEAFHARAFAMPVGLSNVDLGSLDGTATISEEANRERMQDLLDKVKTQG